MSSAATAASSPGTTKPGLSGGLGNEHHRGEGHSVAGAQERGDSDHHEERGVEALHRATDDSSGERAADDERDEEAARAAATDGRRRRRAAQHEHEQHEPRSVVRVERPGDGVVAGPEGEALAGREASDHEDSGEQRAGHERPKDARRLGELLRLHHRRGEHAGGEPGRDSERERADEIAEVEAGLAGDREQPIGVVDRDEREVSGRGGHECRQQQATGQLVLVRHLDREDRAGGRSLEDRGDPRGRPGDHEQPAVRVAEEPRQAALGLRPDRRPQVERRAFEAHRSAEPERRDGRGHARREAADREADSRVMERAEVLVGSRG